MTTPKPPDLYDFQDATLKVGDLIILKQTIGIRNGDRSSWCHRNWYTPKPHEMPSITRLVAAGFMRQGDPFNDLHFYHATPLAADLFGLGPKLRARAGGGL